MIDDADDAWAEALGLLRLFGVERVPKTPEELEDRRTRLRAGIREARQLAATALARGDTAEADRQLGREAGYLRVGSSLPRADAARDAALYAGVRACGGWRALGRAEDDTLTAHRAAFRASYRGHRERRALSATEAQVVALLDSAGFAPKRLTGDS